MITETRRAGLHAPPGACVNTDVRGFCALAALVCLPAVAGEYAVLRTGFRIHAQAHQVSGAEVRLYTLTGVITIPRESIAGFEAEDCIPPPPAAPPRPEPAAGIPVPPPAQLVRQAALEQDLEEAFVPLAESVAKVESAFQPQAVSPKGAVGVMQLMPATAARLGADPYDVKQNVKAGVRYLRDLLMRFRDQDDQVRMALAAYNAGEGAVQRYQGIPPYRETQLYVHKVLEEYRKRKASRLAD